MRSIYSPQPSGTAADPPHRMDSAHIGNAGHAKGGGSQFGEPDGGDQASAAISNSPIVWATFYDIRRYGGLQIFLRAILGGASLVLSDSKEPVGQFLSRLREHGATHITGTPSHWRRVLWSPSASSISPQYARMSGEVADQAIIDNLRAAYPQAKIGHAYASTEAGVGFHVDDEREGFPVSFVGAQRDGVEITDRERFPASPLAGSRVTLSRRRYARDPARRRLRRHWRYHRGAERAVLLRRAGWRDHQRRRNRRSIRRKSKG